MMTRVERFGAGMTGPALAIEAIEKTARARMEERNIRALLLKKRVLSRGNWRGRSRTAKAESRRPRQKRRKRHIKEQALKHEQERYRQVLPVDNREPDEIGEVNAKAQLRDRQSRFDRAIFTRPPRFRSALHSVFRRPRGIGLVIEDCFQNSARVVERETDSRSEEHTSELQSHSFISYAV